MTKMTHPTKEVKSQRPKKPFETPKLSYVKPKLTKQGKVTQLTQSFFGSFSP